jgi:hypothetical protein
MNRFSLSTTCLVVEITLGTSILSNKDIRDHIISRYYVKADGDNIEN